MAATNSISAISETGRLDIEIRDGKVCVLCGEDPVDVAHIVAGKAGQIPFIHSLSPALSGFRMDDTSNLFCLCSLHHHQYNAGFFVFVPSKPQREVLFYHELRDFALRESLVQNNQPDPGRTFPHTLNEIEYIHVHAGRFRACIHNPTRYDQEMFVFDTIDNNPCPLLHFHASPISLMVQAQPHLANITRLKSNKADAAQVDVTSLLNLYRRHPQRKGDLVTVPASYSFTSSISTTHPSSRVLPTIPLSHPSTSAPSMAHRFNSHPEVTVPGLTPGSSASTVYVNKTGLAASGKDEIVDRDDRLVTTVNKKLTLKRKRHESVADTPSNRRTPLPAAHVDNDDMPLATKPKKRIKVKQYESDEKYMPVLGAKNSRDSVDVPKTTVTKAPKAQPVDLSSSSGRSTCIHSRPTASVPAPVSKSEPKVVPFKPTDKSTWIEADESCERCDKGGKDCLVAPTAMARIKTWIKCRAESFVNEEDLQQRPLNTSCWFCKQGHKKSCIFPMMRSVLDETDPVVLLGKGGKLKQKGKAKQVVDHAVSDGNEVRW